jgi:hypothetical protein
VSSGFVFSNYSNISSSFAAHYKSLSAFNDTEETFRRLRTLQVFATDSIHRELTVSQNGEDVTVQAETAYCHIKEIEHEKSVKIYVPKRRKYLEICLAMHLPLAILEYLGVDRTNIRGFPSIISAKSLAVVDAIIDTAGIISLVGVERPEDEDDDEASEADDDEQSAPQATFQGAEPSTPPSTSRAHHLLVTPAAGSHSRSRSAEYFGRSSSPGSSSLHSFASTPATSISEGLTPQEQRELYKKLLMAVVDAARNLAAVPQCGLTRSTTTFPSSLSLSDVDFAVRGSERNDQVGAAGELFVSQIFSLQSQRLLIPFRSLNGSSH